MTKGCRFEASGDRVRIIETDNRTAWEDQLVCELAVTRQSPAAARESADLVARCLTAAGKLAPGQLAKMAEQLEKLAEEAAGHTGADDAMREAMRYVFQQEGWELGIRSVDMSDGTRLHVSNPGGSEIPLAIHVSSRGKSPSFWVMEDSRVIQGTHAYKIPIQAATALKHELSDYIKLHDVGGLVKAVG